MVQRVLFGKSAADQQWSVMLTSAWAVLTQVSALCEGVFWGCQCRDCPVSAASTKWF